MNRARNTGLLAGHRPWHRGDVGHLVANILGTLSDIKCARACRKLHGTERSREGRGRYTGIRLAVPSSSHGTPTVCHRIFFGTTSAIFISFAADHLLCSGGIPGLSRSNTPAFVFICVGIFGYAGLFTRQVQDAIGLPWLLRLLMLVDAFSISLLAIFPGSWTGLIA